MSKLVSTRVVVVALEQAEQRGLRARHARPEEERRVGADRVNERVPGGARVGSCRRAPASGRALGRDGLGIDDEQADVRTVVAVDRGDDPDAGIAADDRRLFGANSAPSSSSIVGASRDPTAAELGDGGRDVLRSSRGSLVTVADRIGHRREQRELARARSRFWSGRTMR